jgi:hypothetical protein
MGILNRRNALIGWIVWQVGKRVAKRKARAAVPTVDRESRRPNTAALVAAVGALGSLLWFWRRKGADESEPEPFR